MKKVFKQKTHLYFELNPKFISDELLEYPCFIKMNFKLLIEIIIIEDLHLIARYRKSEITSM